MIQIDINSANASASGDRITFRALYENTSSYSRVFEPVTVDSWVDIREDAGGTGPEGISLQYDLIIGPNTGTGRTSVIYFECEDDDEETQTASLTVYQGTGVVINSPIWKDTYYYASGFSSYVYSMKYEGVPFYAGKAYCRPGDGGPYIQVNKICQNHLRNNLDVATTGFNAVENQGAVGVFTLCNWDGLEVVAYRFLMDYASDWSGQTAYTMSEPVNGHLDPRMKVLASVYNNGETEISYALEDYGGDYE